MVAILVACASPDLELLGVTTVGGNAGIATTTRNARAILALAGRPDIPVAAGAGRALVRAATRNAESVHGANGLGGVELTESTAPPDPRHAIDLLADTVEGASTPVTLVAVGPLTNVALFFARYPEIAARLGRLVVMGGSIGAGNITPAAEFNIWFDPEAAQRVLSEPAVPTTLVGLDITLRTVLHDDHLAKLRGPVGGRVVEALTHYQHGYRSPGVPVHDAVAVTAVARPGLLTTTPAPVEVDTGYGPSRGNTLVDLRAGSGVDVVVDADVAGVVGYIVDAVASLDS